MRVVYCYVATVSVYLRPPAARAGVDESKTKTTTLKVPAAVGFPVIAPVAEATERPGGRPNAVQLSGGLPPVAARRAEYGVAFLAVGRLAVVTESSAFAVTVPPMFGSSAEPFAPTTPERP
jgi:hypothetical protein